MKTDIMKNGSFPVLQSFLAPPSCEACGVSISSPELLCPRCEAKWVVLSKSHCEICALPFSGEDLQAHRCSECLLNPPSFQSVTAAFEFAGPVLPLIHAVKFGKRLPPLKLLADRAGTAFRETLREWTPDFLLPVPLSWRRRFIRGFNQAYVLAKYLGKMAETEIPRYVFVRRRHTVAQAKKDRKERFKDLKNVFTVTRPKPLKNSRVLIVDDVMTTGATVESLSRVLIKAGCKEVRVFVLARVGKNSS